MWVRWTVLLLLMAGTELKAQEYFHSHFAEVWQRNMDYSMAIAEAMPETHYGFRPTGEAMSFQEHFLHIVDNISSLTAIITGDRKSFYNKDEISELEKDAVLEILDRANSYVLDLIREASIEMVNEEIEFRGVPMTKENIFYLLRDHQAHHRAQCLVYLRLKGGKAPGYVGW
jgi:uncharacterized damage-inducible protein DinB